MGARSGRARAFLVVCALVALSVGFIVVLGGDDTAKEGSASRAALAPLAPEQPRPPGRRRGAHGRRDLVRQARADDNGRYDLRLVPLESFVSEVLAVDVALSGTFQAEFSGLRGGRYSVDLECEADTWTAAWS